METPIPDAVTMAMVPTLNREEFQWRGCQGKPHGFYAGMYVLRANLEHVMIYFEQIDAWVTSPQYDLWAQCSEKKHLMCPNFLDMERMIVGGFSTLLKLRLEGRVW